jgi:hypothetical protein
MQLEDIGRFVIAGGVLLLLIGGGLFLSARLGLRLERLPGDIQIDGEHGRFYFPLATSILISVLLTIVLLIRLLRR